LAGGIEVCFSPWIPRHPQEHDAQRRKHEMREDSLVRNGIIHGLKLNSVNAEGGNEQIYY
jgi:hypothetical protein